MDCGGNTMMKRQICTLVLSGLLTTGVVFAQEAGTAPEMNAQPQNNMQEGGPDGGMHGHGRMDPEQRLAHMTKRYNLTSDQQSRIKPILADEQQQMMSMRGDTAMSRQDKMTKMQSMHQENQQKISAVLTDDQRKKYDADQQKMQERRAEHMHQHDGPGGAEGQAPPPPQPQ